MAEYKIRKSEWVSISRRPLLKLSVVFSILIGLIVVCAALVRNLPLVAGMALLTLTGFYVYWQAGRRVAKAYDDAPLLSELVKVEITNDSIHFSQESGTFRMGWDRLKKWAETKEYFWLYESDLLVRVIPKRALDEQETQIVQANCSGVKRVRV